jgi:UDP-N-acetylglucosamine 3-dehydrogenase
MSRFRVGVIGCGGLGRHHAKGYKASADCELVAAADIRPERVEAFCEEHEIAKGYVDYHEMLAREGLDIVSVCLWPELHAPATIDAARAGVRAVHCEKPMAPTWGAAKEMAAVCASEGVQLTFDHQRRFGKPFRKAKELLDGGAIGALVRLEAFTYNLYDWGTHWFDMLFHYNDERPVEWVMGQIEAPGGRSVFGVMVEGQGLSLFRWQNGVYGLVITGREIMEPAGETPQALKVVNRLMGSEGTIEVIDADGPAVRLCSADTAGEWQTFDVGSGIHDVGPIALGILDLVDALKTGREPVLAARKALQATEVIFATYESSRRRGRVELPLEVEDSAFLSMLEAGTLAVDD